MFQSGFAIQCKCDVGCSSGENDKVHQHATDQNTSERFQNTMSLTCLCDKFEPVEGVDTNGMHIGYSIHMVFVCICNKHLHMRLYITYYVLCITYQILHIRYIITYNILHITYVT